MGGYAGVVIKIPILVLPVLLCWWWMMMMMVVQWGLTIVLHLTAEGWWRTYNCFMPHCRWMSDKGLQWFYTLFTSWWGGLVSSPAMSPSWVMVWDLLHFPLVALPVPPRYTFPNSSLDSCLAQTSNMVQASLAVPPLKNLCLRCSQTMVPMQDMPLGGGGPSPVMSISLLWLSSGGDLAPDSGNAPEHWSESLVWQLPSLPCQRSWGHRSWPGMTCWPQMMTWECAPLKGDWSMSQSIPRPLSFIPSQAAVWWRSTPQVFLLPALSHQSLQWWDVGAGRHSWGHG